MGFSQSVKKLFVPGKTESGNEPVQDPSDEFKRITEELYKRGAELAERNKVLSLLGAIDEIILSSIISKDKTAQQVTSLLVVEAGFQIVSIFTYNKGSNVLERLGISKAKSTVSDSVDENVFLESIPLTQTNNVIIQAINSREIRFSYSLENLLFSETAKDVAINVQQIMGIKSIVVYPLIAKSQLIGAMVFCLSYAEQELLEYQRNLIGRLGESIGIAMDNAMLYGQVQEANQKLKQANEKLKELDSLKNEFVSVASHELRTPMTAIKSYLWMALNDKGGPLNEKQRYYIERGYKSVDRLVRLVNDMLNISRIESGRITIDFESVNLMVLTQEVIDEVLPRAGELGVSVNMQKNESLPPVLADPDKIKEVLFNLIGNSLKFTPKGGSITVNYIQKGDVIETRVADTGAGIEFDDLGKLFQKFGLIEGSYITNQTAVAGTGLGLYICRSIIELHHGEIKVESEGKGKGAVFIFTLKVYSDAELQNFNTSAAGKKETVALIHADV
jgi:signal transduction histidine kinase